jgi:hypothetical protein
LRGKAFFMRALGTTGAESIRNPIKSQYKGYVWLLSSEINILWLFGVPLFDISDPFSLVFCHARIGGMTSSFPWGQRALDHVKEILALAPGGRGSATKSEARAAEYVCARLADLGVADTRLQAFRGLRSIWLFLALAYGFALIGHAAFWLLRQPLGNLPALVVSILAFAFGGFLLWQKMDFRGYPLRSSLPHGPSQNVVAVMPASGEARRKVVLTAHLDSQRAVWLFASDPLLLFYFATTLLGAYGFIFTPLLYLLSILAHQPFLAWIGLISLISHFPAWFTGVTADLGPYSPGANDNASAVGTLLALAERLHQSPLEHTEVWLVFTGCEETGCDGMAAFVKEYGPTLKDALFVNLEEVGIGERLVYLHSEGVLRPRRIQPQVEQFIAEAASEQGISVQPIHAAGLGAFTETGVVWKNGFDGVCFMTLRKGTLWPPEWHRLSDQAGRLQPESLERAHDLVWKLLAKEII